MSFVNWFFLGSTKVVDKFFLNYVYTDTGYIYFLICTMQIWDYGTILYKN